MKISTRLFLPLFVMITIFLFVLSFQAHAGPDCDDAVSISTVPGNGEYTSGWHCDCDPYIPLEFDPANPEEISCGSEYAINITVLNGCPPFLWDVSGNGYTLTMADERTYTLSCSGGT
jgi:hypothetical protein